MDVKAPHVPQDHINIRPESWFLKSQRQATANRMYKIKIVSHYVTFSNINHTPSSPSVSLIYL